MNATKPISKTRVALRTERGFEAISPAFTDKIDAENWFAGNKANYSVGSVFGYWAATTWGDDGARKVPMAL